MKVSLLLLFILPLAMDVRAESRETPQKESKVSFLLSPGVFWEREKRGYELSTLFVFENSFLHGFGPVFGSYDLNGIERKYLELEYLLTIPQMPLAGFSFSAGVGSLREGGLDRNFSQATLGFWYMTPFIYLRWNDSSKFSWLETGVMLKIPLGSF